MPATFFHKPSAKRGNAHHGWLKTYHHFPFASYYDPSERFQSFGALRVINEDRVEPNEGFGTHGHSEAEIFSYIVDGELEHKDSMGNLEIMKRGDVQMTSAGTGVRHSEYNRHGSKEVHFLQIWATPYASRLQPKYYNRVFSDEEKLDKIVTIVAPPEDEGVTDVREAKGPAPVHANIRLGASILSGGKSISQGARPSTTKILVHNIMRSGYREPTAKPIAGGAVLTVEGDGQTAKLEEGDSVFIEGKLGSELKFTNAGEKAAEFLMFEM